MVYGNAVEFEEYLASRGFELPADWDEEKINAALLVASEWLDNQYESIWIGNKLDYNQERSWPRQLAVVQTYPYYVYQTNEIPVEVIKATYEAAKRELISQGSLQVDFQPSQYNSMSIYNAVTVEYNSNASAGDIQTQIPIIQSLMSKLLDSNKGANSNGLSGVAVRV